MAAEPNDARRTISRGDLRRAVNALEQLIRRLDGERTQLGVGFQDQSPASQEAASLGADSLVEDLLGSVNLILAAVFDQADALIRLGRGAVSGDPTPTYAGWSVGRSAVEMLATVYWLIQPGVSAQQRAGRYLSLSMQEAYSQARASGVDTTGTVEQLVAEAANLGLDRVGRPPRAGFGAVPPTRTDQVLALLREQRMYSILSAGSHGEQWAIMFLGYQEGPDDEAGRLSVIKVPPVLGLWWPTSLAIRGLGAVAWAETLYRGGDTAEVVTFVDAMCDLAQLSNDVRPWRTA